MSLLNVKIDYIKIAQYVQQIKHCADKIERELEIARNERIDKRQIYCSNFNCLERTYDDDQDMVE